jgi:hypothetical protein
MSKGTGGTKALKSAHGKAMKVVLWAAFILGFAMSTLLPGTFLGDWYRTAMDQMSSGWRVGVALFLLAFLLARGIHDVIKDLKPDFRAMIMAVSIFTVCSALSGGVATKLNQFGDWSYHLVDQWIVTWVPDGTRIASDSFVIAFELFVLLVAKSQSGNG